MSLTARGYVQLLTTEHCGSVHYYNLYYDRGQQVAHSGGLTRSPLCLIGDAASRCGLSRVGYFIPLNGRRPLNGHPPTFKKHPFSSTLEGARASTVFCVDVKPCAHGRIGRVAPPHDAFCGRSTSVRAAGVRSS